MELHTEELETITELIKGYRRFANLAENDGITFVAPPVAVSDCNGDEIGVIGWGEHDICLTIFEPKSPANGDWMED